MVSPELLRRYPFFASLSEAQIKSIAMISEEVSFPQGTVVFEECKDAAALYLLVDGSVDLIYKSNDDEFYPKVKKEFLAGEVSAGEIFGVSSLIEPYNYNTAAKITKSSRLIKIDAKPLRELLDKDDCLTARIMYQLSKVVMERLINTRVQLATALK